MTYNTLMKLYEKIQVARNAFGICQIPSWATIKKAKKEGRLIADAEEGYIKTASMNPNEQYLLTNQE